MHSTFTPDVFIHILLSGLLQSIQKVAKDIARLVHDDVQQLFSCLDGLLVFVVNGLQLLQCKCVTLKHATSNVLCFQFLGHFLVY